MIGDVTDFGLSSERRLKVFYNVIPEIGGSGCGPCGMARTLEPVTNPDGPLCQIKQ